MPTAARKLDVLIVGAGLGGLAAGLALQTDGHKVTIIDSAPEFAEVSWLSTHPVFLIGPGTNLFSIGWSRVRLPDALSHVAMLTQTSESACRQTQVVFSFAGEWTWRT